jgi:DNA transformation protein
MGKKGDRQTAAGAAFVEGLMPRLTPLREVTSRKMFGGYGLFQNGKMFGLVTSSAEFFLKADQSNMARFKRARSPQHGKMPYFRVPKRVLADDTALLDWARSAVKAAHR